LCIIVVSLVIAAGIALRHAHPAGAVRSFFVQVLHGKFGASAKNTTGGKPIPVQTALFRKLSDLECRAADIRTHFSADNRTILMQAAVPRGRPFEGIILALSQAAQKASYGVSDCQVDEKKQSATITFLSRSKNGPGVVLTVSVSDRYFSGTARMAIVVENAEDTSYQIAVSLLSFAEPLSVSILPGTKKASLIAQLADQHQKEVIVRLPLESINKVPEAIEQSFIMVHYSKDAIETMVSGALKDVPNFTGFANAWGSRACEDSRVMNIILADVRKQHGYFLETRTAKNSVVSRIATALDCPFSEVNARIDKKTEPDIAAEIRRLGASAQVSGTVVVSVSASKQLADALNASRPWFRQNGIRPVFVSELVRHPHE
jgi:polysaccharide deacetylase 2 family uncharacterized protein YibQ